MKKLLTSMRPICQKIDTCPAWNYYKAIDTDSRYLIRGIDYEKLPEVTESYQSKLNTALFELNMEAAQYEIDSVNRNQIVFDLTKKIEVMQADYDYVVALLNYLEVAGNNQEYERQLSVLGFAIRPDLPTSENLKRLRSRNENKIIKLNEKRDELKALTIKETAKPQSIEKSVVLVEKHFNRIGGIDLKTISVKKWLTMKNQVLEDINTAKKWQTKKR